LPLTNIIARFNPKAKEWILLAAHWDSRPTADCEALADKRKLPIPGANDGASGTAVLLELARVFAADRPKVGVVMVFFDGEDYGPGADAMFLGAKHYAAEAAKGLTWPKREHISYGILLDMVGDKDLRIPQEQKSLDAAPEVMNKIWSTAASLGYDKTFPAVPGDAIGDDHIPLIGAGIKCVDIIDFEYGPWHTLDDTPDKCAAQSLKKVGDVVAAVVYKEDGS
jgi:Zn-dependent M28 family amino/carboxypeptidase